MHGLDCFVCHASAVADAREMSLLHVALGNRRLSEQFARSHGVCIRHALRTENATIRDVAATRLRVLRWDLDEAGRKSAWPTRFEASGGEVDAWRRAPTLLHGRVYLGGPPIDLCGNSSEGNVWSDEPGGW